MTVDSVSLANGPIFGSLTPSILDYVAENSPYFK